jgi:predicted dehydrogenase
MSKMNLALIGCGGFGSGYIRELTDHPDARLLAVCDTNREHADAAAEQTGARACTKLDQALETPGLDGVIIATPNYLHASMTCAAAEQGLHVLCEKPMATTSQDARQMIKTCRENDVRLMIGLSSRYGQIFRRALSLTRSGELGTPLLLTNVNHYTLQPPRPGRTWHADAKLMGGGALIQMGIHSLDRLCWFAGAQVKSVYAQIHKAGGRWADNIDLCQVVFDNNILGQVEVSGVANPSRNEMTIHLSKGQIIVGRKDLRWHDGAWHEESYETDRFAVEVQDFVDAIRDDREPFCSGELALPAHELCFAAYRSSSEGRVLRLIEGEYR